MPTRVRLRIALADRPGALASVASTIAKHGGNIEAVDVQRQAGGGEGDQAVDDLTVTFAGPAPVAELGHDLGAGGAGTLVSIRAASHRDPVVVVLEAASTLTALATSGDSQAVDAALAASVGVLCAAPVTWVERAGDPDAHPAAAMAVEQGGALCTPAAGLPEGASEPLAGEGWLLAVPDPTGAPAGRVVLAARSGDQWTATEIARIEGLMALAAAITSV